MKDMLDRDIMVGDTLAYPIDNRLCMAKVSAVAPFAVQMITGEKGTPWVVSDPSRYLICAWAKGSEAA